MCLGGRTDLAWAACPPGASSLCANPSFTADFDGDDVADGVECYWCASVAENTPLWMNPIDTSKDTDSDGALDNLDAYPGINGANSDVASPVTCADPLSGYLQRDTEFNEEDDLVTWTEDHISWQAPRVLVASIDSGGAFGTPVQVDTGVMSIVDNLKNGPEWLYTEASSTGVILYAKRVSGVPTVHAAEWSGSAWTPASLGVEGGTPLGTLVPGDTNAWLLYARQVSGDWTHILCPYEACTTSNEEPGPPINLSPPDPMRLADGQGDDNPILVGVDYVGSSSYKRLFRWTPSASEYYTADAPPDKFSGWLWQDSDGNNLVVTMDQIYSGTATGPGLIRIYDADTCSGGSCALWQTIPVGPLQFPYVVSPEPFIAHNDTSYIVYAASGGPYNNGGFPSRVIIAEVAASAVGASYNGVDETMLVRRVDGGQTESAAWKDPEGFRYGTSSSWVYSYDQSSSDTRRCPVGTL